ncbi:hypothetical protein ACFX13_006521 [Malus domestica]
MGNNDGGIIVRRVGHFRMLETASGERLRYSLYVNQQARKLFPNIFHLFLNSAALETEGDLKPDGSIKAMEVVHTPASKRSENYHWSSLEFRG